MIPRHLHRTRKCARCGRAAPRDAPTFCGRWRLVAGDHGWRGAGRCAGHRRVAWFPCGRFLRRSSFRSRAGLDRRFHPRAMSRFRGVRSTRISWAGGWRASGGRMRGHPRCDRNPCSYRREMRAARRGGGRWRMLGDSRFLSARDPASYSRG